MRILHINPYSDNALYDNLYNLQKLDNDVNVILPLNKNTKSEKDSNSLIDKAFVFNDIDRFLYFRKQKKIVKYIENNYNVKDFDIIHAHTLFSSGYSAMKLSKKYGVPFVVNIQNTDVNIFFKKVKFLKSVGNRILKEALKCIYISSAYKERVEKLYLSPKNFDSIHNKSHVIPYGIDEFWIKNKSVGKTLSNKQKVNILTVGDINNNKNQIEVSKVCEALMSKGYEISYNIVGRIVDKTIFDFLNTKKYINYLGWQKKEELINTYRKNDIFIMLSKTETFGLVYGEAMSQGMPLIYTKNEGFDKQFIDGFVGMAAELGGGLDTVEKIEKIISNYEVISANAISAVENFDWAEISKKYSDIYLKKA